MIGAGFHVLRAGACARETRAACTNDSNRRALIRRAGCTWMRAPACALCNRRPAWALAAYIG